MPLCSLQCAKQPHPYRRDKLSPPAAAPHPLSQTTAASPPYRPAARACPALPSGRGWPCSHPGAPSPPRRSAARVATGRGRSSRSGCRQSLNPWRAERAKPGTAEAIVALAARRRRSVAPGCGQAHPTPMLPELDHSVAPGCQCQPHSATRAPHR